ncbi:FAD-binding oxidoreductase [Roseateles sp. YR242]|uniref:FAD-binding oxidoreductase n=1 Tax=Roseateles sp. YR242 TaxID=1855305 RepID=UPI00210100AC|nr:FAD-binding oxidoreductase [Roseateles sp. YR242]
MKSLATAGLLTLPPMRALAAQPLLVTNVTGLYSVQVAHLETPRSTVEVSTLIRHWSGQVGIGGGRYSMGGQVAVHAGLHLDMRRMNRLVWVRAADHQVRVQAGMRWRDLQDVLDPLGLAVKTMQSFSNFTVGGSVSVNCHGRYVGHGSIGHTVRALQLVMADGEVVETSDSVRPELFRAAIGGYGAIAVITEVELEVTDNIRIERVVEAVPLARYVAHFKEKVLADKHAIMHNADLLPPTFDNPVCVTWRQVPETTPLTETDRLVPRDQSYGLEQNVIWSVTELPGGQTLRKDIVQPMLLGKPAVKWLNHEASLDVASLEPRTRAMSTYVLQEYFIPERQAVSFVREMAKVLRRHEVVALNISIRHAPADTTSLLPWAREDVFSFVLYYKQRTWTAAQQEVGRWTRELIELSLQHGGRYYLPYQLHATRQQFESAYPEVAELRQLKKQVDPDGKFSNELWRKYL